MCGIVGYIGTKNATPILLQGLKRLEYRGYDSAGIAVNVDGKVQLYKAEGKLQNLKDIVVVATDAGSSKKAYKYSEFFNCPLALIDKRREDNNDKAVATSIIGDVKGKTALIIGSEGFGLKEIVRKNCDFIASIPLKGKVNSLNASVAAGILIYEVLRGKNE